jgi:DNA-binding IscR family transcriptional regulator
VWAEVGEHMRDHLASFTLADMVSQARGLATPKPALRHP